MTLRKMSICADETYEGSYLPWCDDQGLSPMGFTRFGTIMKGDLGVQYVEGSKRGYYVGRRWPIAM